MAVPNVKYSVKLHFAENYSGAFTVGALVFDVLMESALVLDDVNVYAEAGANTALVNEANVAVMVG